MLQIDKVRFHLTVRASRHGPAQVLRAPASAAAAAFTSPAVRRLEEAARQHEQIVARYQAPAPIRSAGVRAPAPRRAPRAPAPSLPPIPLPLMSGGGPSPGSSGGGNVAALLRGSQGRPLEGGVRTQMESHFARDLSGVRVHTGPAAQTAARSLGARAFTVGQDIYFGGGQFAPGTATGRGLLGHELAHVDQFYRGQVGLGQSQFSRDGSIAIGGSRALEAFAEAHERRLASGEGGGASNLSKIEDVVVRGDLGDARGEVERIVRAAVGRAEEALDRRKRNGTVDQLRVRAIVDPADPDAASRALADQIVRRALAAIQREAVSSSGPLLAFLAKFTTAWGSPMTFAWEKEGGSPEILRYYRPSSTSDAEWNEKLKELRSELSDIWTKTRDSEKYYAHFREWRKKNGAGSYEGLVKTSKAPPYVRDHLHQEVGEDCWETTHKSYEDDTDAIFQQIRWLDKDSGLGEGGYHFHMAFKRQRAKAEQLAALGAHLNDYAALNMYSAVEGSVKNRASKGPNISHKFLGAYTEESTRKLAQVLGMASIPYNSSWSGIEQTDPNGAQIGRWKFAATAVRHHYKDPEIIGFEFRAATGQGVRERIEKVATALGSDTATMSIHGRGKPYTLDQLVGMPHMGPEALKACSRRLLTFLAAAANEAEHVPWSMDDKHKELLYRWSLAFIEWEKHPAIPDSDRERIRAAREKLLKALEDVATKHGVPEQENVQLHQVSVDKTAQLDVQEQIAMWSRDTRVWQLF